MFFSMVMGANLIKINSWLAISRRDYSMVDKDDIKLDSPNTLIQANGRWAREMGKEYRLPSLLNIQEIFLTIRKQAMVA